MKWVYGRKSLWLLSSLAVASVWMSGSDLLDRSRDAVATDDATSRPAASFLADAQRQIDEREYRASETPGGLQAPNRRHALRTYFDPGGIRVVDRTATEDSELLAMRLHAIGRPGASVLVGRGEVTSDGTRVEIVRDAVVEWYENDSAGLEQGFSLPVRPIGAGPVVVEIAVAGATAQQNGTDSVRLSTDTGRQLDYGKLVAWDAAGSVLPVQLVAASTRRIELRVDDRGAAYPIVIDPILTAVVDSAVWSVQTLANFGTSVADAGDVNGDGYGDVIVGAPYYDAGQSNEGAAFVFLGSASGITTSTSLTAASQIESDQVDANLGLSVSGAGDVNGDGYDDVIVGSLLFDGGQLDEGAAFVFLGSASGIVAVGNPANAGARHQSNQVGARFGVSVSAAGDVDGDGYDDVIVGADRYDAGEIDEGAAFVFLGGAAGMADGTPANAAAQLESNQVNAYLGEHVSGAGDVNGDGYDDVIVGAPSYDGGQAFEGAAFVFHGSASGVVDGNPLTAATQLESNQASALMGRVADAGDVNGDGYDDVIVGAPFFDAGQSNEGAAFVFLGSSTGIADGNPGNAASQLESDEANAFAGGSVAGIGDIDGDGYDEVVVGANGFDPIGATFVYRGSASGIIANGNPGNADALLPGQVDGSSFGDSVSGAGDVDGDGYTDVIVGDRQWSTGNNGAAYLFHGGSPASAYPIVNPIAAWTSSWWGIVPNAQPENMIDGSGLSGSGEIRSQTHDNPSNASTMWHAGGTDGGLGGPTGTPPVVAAQAVVFDLGNWVDLEGVFIWNHNQAGQSARGVKDFEILVSSDTDPLTAQFTSLGMFTLARAGGGVAEPSQFRAFSAVDVRLVEFAIASTHSGLTNDWVGLSEVRFAASPGPMDWVALDDPGNACDSQAQGCFGGVGNYVQIAKHAVTCGEYTEFLNAVAATDTYGLYATEMGISTNPGGITRSGAPGSHSYLAIPGRENTPVNWVSFWDAVRLANWLHNGKPTGAQDATTTEDGAYTLTPISVANNTATRNPGARYFVPSEYEWYKVAYYDTMTMTYFDYPAGSDTQTTCAAPGPTPNTAQCASAGGFDLMDVGSYTGSASPNGTFDQGGNLWEWNEAINGATRGLRGGFFYGSASLLAASNRSEATATDEPGTVGIRLARAVPMPTAPAVPLLGPLGLVVLSGLLGIAGLRRLRA